jgi:uncharacterized membrane protein YkoI
MYRSDADETVTVVVSDLSGLPWHHHLMMRISCRELGTRWPVVLFALLAGVVAFVAVADDDHDRDHDHERAREAFERGEILSLAEVIAAARPHIDGEIVEAELEREHGVWVYELKYIHRSGRVSELYVDARTARVIGAEDD